MCREIVARVEVKMMTRAQTHGTRHPSTEVSEPLVKPNARRRRQMVHRSVLSLEGQIAALEGREVLTESQRQTVLRISKMLESICSEFKTYHYEIMDSLESDEDATRELEVFDEHQKKTMEVIDRLVDVGTRTRGQNGTVIDN